MKHPLPKRVTEWAVGVTTSPRREPTIHRTVDSLKESGFFPTVFAEPGSFVDVDAPVVQRTFRHGCWKNYVETLRDLLSLKPDAQAIAVFQDDIVICKNVKDFLEHDLWPGLRTGAVSLYSAEEYESQGVVGIDKRGFMVLGLCAVVYPRDVAHRLVHEFGHDWRGCHCKTSYVDDVTKKKAADTWVSSSLKAMGRDVFHYRPSLVQHISDVSSVGHGGRHQVRPDTNVKYRMSEHFPGEKADVFDVWKNSMPWFRWSLPEGHQIYKEDDHIPQLPVSVVVPGYGCADLTISCISQLEKSSVRPRLVYVDDGSSDSEFEQVSSFIDSCSLDSKVIRHEKNMGFTKSCNDGIEASPGHHVLLLNNDTMIHPDCIEKLRYHAERHERVSAVGPMTGDDGAQSLKHPANRRNAKYRGDFQAERYLVDVGNSLNRKLVDQREVLSGFCMLMSKDAIEKFGLLDSEFDSGLGADDEWCIRASRQGWRNLIVYDAWCAHLHKQTFRRQGIDRAGLQRAAVKTLKRKVG